MPEELSVDIDVDWSDALSGVDELASSIQSALESGASAGVDAVSSALSGIDPGDIEIPVDADVDAAEASIGSLADQPPVEIPVEIDLSSAEGELGSIGSGDSVTIPVDADVSAAQSEIAGLEGGEVTVTVDAETGDSAEQVDDVTQSLTGAGGAAQSSEGSLAGVSTAFTSLGAVSGATQGELGGVTGALRSIGPGGAVAGAGILAVGASLGTMFAAGLKGTAATERLNLVFGEMSGAAQKINIGGLNGDLGELATKSGNSGAALKQSVASLGQFAISSGQSKEAARGFTEQVSALALRATAMNPQLGEAGDVTDRLGLALARGGRSAARYGIDLSAAEIKTRALANTGKTVAADLTQVEKAMAGAQLATEKLGGSIGKDFQAGTQQAAVQLKALKAEIASALGAAGAPLVAPLIEALHSIVPAITAVSSALGTLGGAAVVPISQLAGVLGGVPGPLLAIGAAAAVAAIGLNKMGEGFGIRVGAANFVQTLERMAPQIGIVGAAIGVMGVASDNAAEATLGFATAGASLGFLFGGPLGAGIGAAAGALTGFTLQMAHATSQTDAVDASVSSLSSAISSKQVPAIESAVNSVIRTTAAMGGLARANQETAAGQADFSRGLTGSAAAIHALGSGIQEYNIHSHQGKIFQDAFNDAIAKGPEVAGPALAAYDNMGVSTGLMHLQLDTLVSSLSATKSAVAAVQVAASPLTATFAQAASAMGEEATQNFNVINALGAREKATVDSTKAHQAFVQAIATGSAEQVRAAGQAVAAADAQKAFATALTEGKTAQEAGAAGLTAYGAALDDLIAKTPAGPLHDTLVQLREDANNLNNTPVSVPVDVNDAGALVKLSALQAEADRVAHGKPVELKVLTRGFPEAEGQLDRLKGHGDILKDPVKMTTILEDLASNDLNKLKADLDSFGLTKKEATVTANVEGQQEVEALKGSIEGMTDKQVQAVADAIGKGDVDGLKASVSGLTGKQVAAIANAVGEPAVRSLAGAVLGLSPKTVAAIANAFGEPAVRNLVASVGSLSPKTVAAIANAIGEGDVHALNAAVQGLTPKQVEAIAHAIGTGDVNAMNAAINALHNKDVYVTTHHRLVVEPGATDAPLAAGGTVPYGGAAQAGLSIRGSSAVLVGERGPELAILPGGTDVINNPRTRARLQRGGEGGGDIVINIDAKGATREAVRDLKKIDWREVNRQVGQEQRRSSFLGGR